MISLSKKERSVTIYDNLLRGYDKPISIWLYISHSVKNIDSYILHTAVFNAINCKSDF